MRHEPDRGTKHPHSHAEPTPEVMPALLKPKDAASFLGISERSLWTISAPRGPLAVVRIGTAVRYTHTDLMVYIAAQRQEGVTTRNAT